MLIPVLLLGATVLIADFKKIFYLFFAVVPFSVEMFFSNGLGTDLPTEPLALLLTGISILLFLHRFEHIDKRYIGNGITIILLVHMAWIFFVSIYSQNQIISIKYFLAKSWYVIPFYFLPFYLLKDRLDIERVMKVLLFFTSLVMMVIMIKHAAKGFTFKAINKAAHPMYRNHVIYAGLLVLLCPYIWYFYTRARNKIGWIILGAVYLIAIYLTYTRAAYVCVMIMVGTYFVIKYKYGKIAVVVSLIVAGVATNSLIQDNKYLDFAPEYKKTVSHMKFDNLIEATYKLEDISTMERVYRWVAGLQMVKDRPMLGFGPGCFYPFYKDYVVSSFRTYVSDNPDKSGIHNYFFMILVEQGFLGLLIILFLCVYPVLYGQKVYHQLADPYDRNLVMVSILCLIAFNALLIINDLIETDKLGSFFWLNLSILTMMGIRGKKKQAEA
jgi:O-antigen ligase